MIAVIFLILIGEEEQGSFDAIVNDILSSYPKEKNKVFNRIRHEWI